ncbi:MAG TPA: hypothetical protein PLD88_03805 [Candidatus Berkiella sp.]|nr:hypothetical protein [Candidatus Berkiella sp.]
MKTADPEKFMQAGLEQKNTSYTPIQNITADNISGYSSLLSFIYLN